MALVLAVCVVGELQQAKIYNQSQPAKTERANNPSGQFAAPAGSGNRAEERGQESHWYNHVTDWLLVLFNGILAVFTARLFYNASEQGRDLKASIVVAERSAKAAEDAARAAELSAKAAIGVKLPSVHVRKIELYKPGPPYDQLGKAYLYRVDDGRPPNNAQISIVFVNIGETTARIASICFEYFVGPRLPAEPTYKRILPFTEAVIRGGDGEFDFRPVNFFIQLTDAESRALDLPLANHLWIYGYISYLDFMNMPHEYRYCQRWLTTSFLGSPTGFIPEFYIPEAYTRSH